MYELKVPTCRITVEVHWDSGTPLRGSMYHADSTHETGKAEQLAATLNDLSREPVALDTLRVDERGIPRCRVKGGRFDGRLSRAATYQLLQHAEPDEGRGRPALVLGGQRYPVPGL